MKRNKGLGFVYQPKYKDRSGELKVSPTWWISYSHRGKKIRLSSGSEKRADAVKLLKVKLAEVGSGRPVIPSAERTTFEGLLTILVDDYKANSRRSLNKLLSRLRHLRQFFGLDRAIDVTADRITAYTAHRLKECAKPASINRELAALRRAFKLAHEAGKATPPAIHLLHEDNARKGFFDEQQFEAVLALLSDDLKPVIRTAYITGWRVPSELLTRSKHHLDLEAGWLRLEPGETKNGKGRMFPLTPELHDILQAQLDHTRAVERETRRIIPWLFHRAGSPIKDFRFAWKKACKTAGVPRRIPHDFRRTAVRNLERAGVSRSAAMAMTGHLTESVYRRYAINDESSLKEAATKLAAFHRAGRLSANVRSVKDGSKTD